MCGSPTSHNGKPGSSPAAACAMRSTWLCAPLRVAALPAGTPEKPSAASRLPAAQQPADSTPAQDSSTAASAADAAPAGSDAGRRISRDAADSHASDSPAKAAAAAGGAKQAASTSASAEASQRAAGAAAPEGGKAVRSVAEFAKEVAALQEENRKLKEMLHNQVTLTEHTACPLHMTCV